MKVKSEVSSDYAEPFEQKNEPEDFYLQLINILTRLQATKNSKEYLYLLNDYVKITHFDKDKLSLFSFDNDSYIIIERCSELLQEKPVENACEWDTIQTSSTPKRSAGSLDKTNELDITGSPLSCHFLELKSPEFDIQDGLDSFKFKFPIRTYNGFSVRTARKHLNKLNVLLKDFKMRQIYLPPVWIACDGKDKSGIAFLGLHHSERNNNIVTMISEGPIIGPNSLPSLDHITSHFNLGSVLPRVKTKVKASYEIVPQKSEKASSSVDLHCIWSQTLSTLSSPSLDATTLVALHLELDDESSPARNLYLEFGILKNFIKGLNEKCLKWLKRKKEHKVAALLQDYFDGYGETERSIQTPRGTVPDLDKMIESKFLAMSSNKEFTEEIWDVLKESASLSELSDGFKTVFKNVSSGIIRPRIHVKNETEFAAVCRGLMRGQGSIPSLENWDAINMLIQIGLEKIKKDYVSVFQVCDLVNMEQLCCYTNWSPKRTPYTECLEKLEKMHVVLQIVVTLKRALNLPNTVLSHLASKTLIDLEKITELPRDFEYQLDTPLLKTFLNTGLPTIWIFETRSVCDENPNYEKVLCFAIKKDECFFKLKADEDEEKSPTVTCDNKNIDEQTFYCLSVEKIGEIF